MWVMKRQRAAFFLEPLRIDLEIPPESSDQYCKGDNKSWLKFRDNCYKIFPKSSKNTSHVAWDFAYARNQCLKVDAVPIYIESHEENYFLASKVHKLAYRLKSYVQMHF